MALPPPQPAGPAPRRGEGKRPARGLMGTVVLCAPAGAPRGDESSRRASHAAPGGGPGAEAGGLHFPRCSAGASGRADGGSARRLNAGGRSGAMELSALVRKLGNGSHPSAVGRGSVRPGGALWEPGRPCPASATPPRSCACCSSTPLPAAGVEGAVALP